MAEAGVKRLHWGCGAFTPAGWINCDLRDGPGVDIACDVRDGLPLASDSIDYISAQHVLPELQIWDQVPALAELRRVLKPGGALRLSLPDFDKAIAAYQSGREDYFQWNFESASGNFVCHLLWHSTIRTIFNYEFSEELLRKSGFDRIDRVSYRETNTAFDEIVELDSRPMESLYLEALK